MQNESPLDRLAVLIDADNAEAALFENVFSEIASLGEATVRRIYGDFTSQQSSQWKKQLQRFSIRPMQQFAYTTGKNSTDSALIIDAMDLLHSGLFDGFCILSSDSDFTGLAIRIRESGKKVYGFGRSTTPDAFKNACHVFIETETLKDETRIKTPSARQSEIGTINVRPSDTSGLPQPEAPKTLPEDVLRMIRQASEKLADNDGWLFLGALGSFIRQIKSDFSPKKYGCSSGKLSSFVREFNSYFEYKEKSIGGGPMKHIFIRLRPEHA
jgi:uncharacterized LabA/DUF88 family protein